MTIAAHEFIQIRMKEALREYSAVYHKTRISRQFNFVIRVLSNT